MIKDAVDPGTVAQRHQHAVTTLQNTQPADLIACDQIGATGLRCADILRDLQVRP